MVETRVMLTRCKTCNSMIERTEGGIKAATAKFGGVVCTKCSRLKDKEREKWKRSIGQKKVIVNCPVCQKPTSTKEYKLKSYARKGGKKCKECCRKISSTTMKRTMAGLSKEQKTANTMLAMASRTPESRSLAVKKQWETLKNDPRKMQEICDLHSNRMKKVWKEYPEETKNHIVEAFCKSYGKSRSESSNALKRAMISESIYDGFESEEVFHGFIPDEINHELKIIVEMYGDLYHCNPKRYKDKKQYVSAIKRTVEQQWQ